MMVPVLVPIEIIKGENYGKPNTYIDMTTQKSQLGINARKPVPETTPYPPGPKDTPLQPDNEPIKKRF
jgi:hypothetical protein